MATTKQEPATPVRCDCGRTPCTVKNRGKYMLACPDLLTCGGRSGWFGDEQAAINNWNLLTNSRKAFRGGRSWQRLSPARCCTKSARAA